MTALLAAFAAACQGADDLDPIEQRGASTAAFGDDNRLLVSIEPGRVDEVVRSSRAAFVVSLHAAGPFATVELDNGNFVEQRVLVELGNVDTAAVVYPRTRPLDDAARRDARCDDIVAADLPGLELAPLVNEVVSSADGGQALLADVTLPACSALTLSARLAPTAAAWSMAIVNADADEPTRFARALDAVIALDVDYVHLIGSADRPDDRDRYLWTREELAATGIPWGVSFAVGNRDAATAFYDTFGVADFSFDVGNFRLVTFDTSSRVVGDARLAWLNQQGGAPAGLAITAVPPWDVDRLGRDNLAAVAESQRTHATLLAGGFTRVVSAAGDHVASAEIAGIRYLDLGRAARVESGRDVTLIEVFNPWSTPTECDDAVACAGALTVSVDPGPR